MEEQFVPYKLSVKLKALGFNEKCFGGYDYVTEGQEPEFKLALFSVNNDPKWYESRKMIPSPLWQQAFDWFREKGIYSYIHEIYEDKDDKHYSFHYQFRSEKLQALIGESSYTFSLHNLTYKEARLTCLEKLIELVKNKKG